MGEDHDNELYPELNRLRTVRNHFAREVAAHDFSLTEIAKHIPSLATLSKIKKLVESVSVDPHRTEMDQEMLDRLKVSVSTYQRIFIEPCKNALHRIQERHKLVVDFSKTRRIAL